MSNNLNAINKAYKVLNLKHGATLAEVQIRYKKLLDEFHPDKQTEDLKDFFKKETKNIVDSYNIIVKYLSNNVDNKVGDNKLNDDNSNKQYDKTDRMDLSEPNYIADTDNRNSITFISNTDILSSAWNSLKGYWGLAIGVSFIYGLITSFAQQLFIIPFLIVAGPLSLGYAIFTLNIVRKKNPDISNLFDGFNLFGKALGLYFLKGLIVFFGLILFIIPGIYLSLMYSQIFFVLADNKEIKSFEALEISKQIMDGHKFKLFLLQLLYFILVLLSAFTLFIGLIVIIPWIRVTNAKFYEYVKNNPISN